MDTFLRPHPFAIIGAHAQASIPLAFLIMKDKKEALKMLCCSIIARAVEVYFEPIAFQSFTPMVMGICASAAVQKGVFRDETPLPFFKANYLNLGARTVVWVTALGFHSTMGTGNIAAMAIGSSGAAAVAIWVVYKIAKKILPEEKPKTA